MKIKIKNWLKKHKRNIENISVFIIVMLIGILCCEFINFSLGLGICFEGVVFGNWIFIKILNKFDNE